MPLCGARSMHLQMSNCLFRHGHSSKLICWRSLSGILNDYALYRSTQSLTLCWIASRIIHYRSVITTTHDNECWQIGTVSPRPHISWIKLRISSRWRRLCKPKCGSENCPFPQNNTFLHGTTRVHTTKAETLVATGRQTEIPRYICNSIPHPVPCKSMR